MRKVNRKKYLGTVPGDSFELVGTFSLASTGSNWRIYEDLTSSSKWWAYRVISEKPVKNKANYSLAFDEGQDRLSGKDLPIMAMHHPAMLKAFLDHTGLKPKFWGIEFSESVSDMLKAEAEAKNA